MINGKNYFLSWLWAQIIRSCQFSLALHWQWITDFYLDGVWCERWATKSCCFKFERIELLGALWILDDAWATIFRITWLWDLDSFWILNYLNWIDGTFWIRCLEVDFIWVLICCIWVKLFDNLLNNSIHWLNNRVLYAAISYFQDKSSIIICWFKTWNCCCFNRESDILFRGCLDRSCETFIDGSALFVFVRIVDGDWLFR